MVKKRTKEEISAGAVVFHIRDGQPLFLLIRDSYRNWGFPKGHVEPDEAPDTAALREVGEETGLRSLALRGEIDIIDWYFRFRGRLVHKFCHFFLVESVDEATSPQREEGITSCRWLPLNEALTLISYANAREVLEHAAELIQRLGNRDSGIGNREQQTSPP
ncbi:MAG: NUDIX hydrolase [Gemmatimonadaceae bacterium]